LSIGSDLNELIRDEGVSQYNQLQIINIVKRFYGDVSA
jgi:hypothetical protein